MNQLLATLNTMFRAMMKPFPNQRPGAKTLLKDHCSKFNLKNDVLARRDLFKGFITDKEHSRVMKVVTEYQPKINGFEGYLSGGKPSI